MTFDEIFAAIKPQDDRPISVHVRREDWDESTFAFLARRSRFVYNSAWVPEEPFPHVIVKARYDKHQPPAFRWTFEVMRELTVNDTMKRWDIICPLEEKHYDQSKQD
jgi:hypothetical protein